jgi:hypothetical protein
MDGAAECLYHLGWDGKKEYIGVIGACDISTGDDIGMNVATGEVFRVLVPSIDIGYYILLYGIEGDGILIIP